MSNSVPEATATDRAARLAAELLRHRVQLHAQSAQSGVAATAFAALILASMLWDDLPGPLLPVWLGALAVVLTLRLGLVWRQKQEAPVDGPSQARWLKIHRAAFLLHGLVWFGLILGLGGLTSHAARDTAAFILSALVGGALVTASFDTLASWLFAGPIATGLFVRLFAQPDGPEGGLAAVAAMFMVIMAGAARRGSEQVAQSVVARVDERARFDDARRYAHDAEQARLALAEQHELQQQLIRETLQGYWFIAPDGRTLDVNPAMCELLGRQREEILRMSVQDFFTGADREVLESQLARRQAGETGGYGIDVVRPDGSRRHAYNQATPIHDGQGRLVGSIGLWTDLTERLAQEQELRTYERVTNSLTDMVCVVGPDRRLRLVNDAWCEVSGRPRVEALGASVHGTCHGADDAAWVAALDACLREGRMSTVVTPAVLRDEPAATLQTSFYPYRDGETDARSVILVTRDITLQARDRAAVETSAVYLRRTLNATGEAIFASDSDDPHAPVRFANEQTYEMWGIPHDPDRALTPAMIMAAARPLHFDPDLQARTVRDVIASNQPHEARVRLRDGRVIFRRCEPALLDGRWLRVWSFRDVTAEENSLDLVTQREAEQRALLSAFPGYIAVADEAHRYAFVNDRVASLHGWPAEDMIGRTISDVLGEERYLLNLPELERAGAGEIVRADRSYPATPGRPRLDLEVTHVAGPRSPDGRQRFYSFAVDITERRRAQEALALARDEAERANQAKSQFLSHMSHELRTPMNAILGFAQLLRRDQRPPLAHHQLGYAQQILRGAQHLLDLINEILDLSRIEAGRLAVNPGVVALSDLAADCLSFVGELARDRGVALRPSLGLSPVRGSAEPSVWADARRLRQVLLNLLGNAIKFNRSGGHVQLVCEHQGGYVLLEVHDSGRGIRDTDRDRVFMPFERLDNERGTAEGTGIGLALSRRLMEAMGGEIGFTSEAGVGSCFWIRIPAHAPAWPHEATGTPSALHEPMPSNPLSFDRRPLPASDPAYPWRTPSPGDAGLGGSPLVGSQRLLQASAASPGAPAVPAVTVLYIDDNEVNLLLVETLLAEVPGLRILTASNPESGLQLARSERPRLVLLDIHMPEMDGYEVLARLRADLITADIPVVAVSADALPADMNAARAAGFSTYLTKPVDLERLLATVRRLAMDGPE